MNYIYLGIGIIVGIIFLGMGKNARNRKAIPIEVTKKLKSNKKMDEYNEWCNTESTADTVIAVSLFVFGISATFMDSNLLVANILSILSLIVFIVGFIMRMSNNKKHLNHFFI